MLGRISSADNPDNNEKSMVDYFWLLRHKLLRNIYVE